MRIGSKFIKYLLLINVISSVVGMIAMIIGYSKVNVSLDAVDIFDVLTGNCCAIDKILGAIKSNLYYSESHYYIIVSGIFMGVCISSGLGVSLLVYLSEEKEERKVLSSVNPVYGV